MASADQGDPSGPAERGGLTQAESPYLRGEAFGGADSPFLHELDEGESWSRPPASAAQRLFKIPERVRDAVGAACPAFLAANPSEDYEQYIAAPTTGRMTPFINGRSWGGVAARKNQVEAFNAMQAAVEGLKAKESLLIAAWHFDPSLPLTRTNAAGKNALGNKTWGELVQRKARDGVKVRIIMTDFDPVAVNLHSILYQTFLPAIDKLVAGLGSKADNLKYIVSRHPAVHTKVITAKIHLDFHVGSHHQKFMVLRTGKGTVAFCGGLDIAYMRTPARWGELKKSDYRWLWHDIHSRLEGLIARDLEREFVLRWNREKDQSVVTAQSGWGAMETLSQAAASTIDKASDRNKQQLQMWRTVSVAGTPICTTRRDDIWQGYLRLIGCASRLLYMENQYFREPLMADAIVKQAVAQPDLLVIVIVPSETDDLPDMVKKHGDSLQHEFFTRLVNGVPDTRLRVYSMFHRIIHSKFIMADDRVLSIGSANANPRGFQLDAELNVTLDNPTAAASFRHRLWAHNLGLAETKVAAWGQSDFIPRWDAVAAANEAARANPTKMTGEAIIKFDPLKEKGSRQKDIHDVETEAADRPAAW